jgi:L-fucose isomerase-like protein
MIDGITKEELKVKIERKKKSLAYSQDKIDKGLIFDIEVECQISRMIAYGKEELKKMEEQLKEMEEQ